MTQTGPLSPTPSLILFFICLSPSLSCSFLLPSICPCLFIFTFSFLSAPALLSPFFCVVQTREWQFGSHVTFLSQHNCRSLSLVDFFERALVSRVTDYGGTTSLFSAARPPLPLSIALSVNVWVSVCVSLSRSHTQALVDQVARHAETVTGLSLPLPPLPPLLFHQVDRKDNWTRRWVKQTQLLFCLCF